MRPVPASLSLLAVDARSTCTHHNGAHFVRAIPSEQASTRNLRYPRRFAANRAFHRCRHVRAGGLPDERRCAYTRQSRPSFPVRLWSARESDLRASSPPCDGHYVVELRIDASSIVPLGLHRSSPSLLRRELLAARPPTLPSACSHHTGEHDKRARGQSGKRPLVHKKLSFSTQFPKIPPNPQPPVPRKLVSLGRARSRGAPLGPRPRRSGAPRRRTPPRAQIRSVAR
jgi:hypothetical protein